MESVVWAIRSTASKGYLSVIDVSALGVISMTLQPSRSGRHQRSPLPSPSSTLRSFHPTSQPSEPAQSLRQCNGPYSCFDRRCETTLDGSTVCLIPPDRL